MSWVAVASLVNGDTLTPSWWNGIRSRQQLQLAGLSVRDGEMLYSIGRNNTFTVTGPPNGGLFRHNGRWPYFSPLVGHDSDGAPASYAAVSFQSTADDSALFTWGLVRTRLRRDVRA